MTSHNSSPITPFSGPNNQFQIKHTKPVVPFWEIFKNVFPLIKDNFLIIAAFAALAALASHLFEKTIFSYFIGDFAQIFAQINQPQPNNETLQQIAQGSILYNLSNVLFTFLVMMPIFFQAACRQIYALWHNQEVTVKDWSFGLNNYVTGLGISINMLFFFFILYLMACGIMFLAAFGGTLAAKFISGPIITIVELSIFFYLLVRFVWPRARRLAVLLFVIFFKAFDEKKGSWAKLSSIVYLQLNAPTYRQSLNQALLILVFSIVTIALVGIILMLMLHKTTLMFSLSQLLFVWGKYMALFWFGLAVAGFYHLNMISTPGAEGINGPPANEETGDGAQLR